MQGAQVEPSIDAITERGQVTSETFPKVERMVGTGKTGLEIVENGVDPFELGYIFGLSGYDCWLQPTLVTAAEQAVRQRRLRWSAPDDFSPRPK
jgi:hypothetical protein